MKFKATYYLDLPLFCNTSDEEFLSHLQRQVPHNQCPRCVADIVYECYKYSYCTKVENNKSRHQSQTKFGTKVEFAEWLVKIGDGEICVNNDGEVEFRLPDDIMIRSIDEPVAAIIKSTYPSILDHVGDGRYFQNRAILAPTNEIVQEINIDQSVELYNGTRLIVTAIGKHIIEDKTIHEKNTGVKVFIPRMVLSPSDITKFPIRFQRRQFSISVCYAMTINKSQEQFFPHVGLYLPKSVFSHDQLYVAFSSVINTKGLKVLALDGKDNSTDTIINIVYKKVFAKL
ncbi:hypothetical protein OROMI_021992 [Orobanche minor]